MDKLQGKDDILSLIQKDTWMMDVLQTVSDIHLPDWWVGAGFVRGKVWDFLHGYNKRTPLPDIDVIYFDSSDISKRTEESIKSKLQKQNPSIIWQVKNQARMHILHGDKPYKDAEEGLSRWVETATCVGIKLTYNGKLQLAAPLGIDDLINLIVRPNPYVKQQDNIFENRIQKKNWLKLWPKLCVERE